MMKILCLLVVLANIFLLMLEYRSGAFTVDKKNAEQQIITGKEQILLLRELKKESQTLLPKINQETQGDLKHTDTATTKQAEYPQAKLP